MAALKYSLINVAPLRGLVPVIQGRPEQLWTVYVVGRRAISRPMKIGFSLDVIKRLGQLQVGNHEELAYYSLAWFPDGATAQRVETAAHDILGTGGRHLHGEWFDVDPAVATSAIAEAAADLSIPLLTHVEYVGLLRPKRDLDAPQPKRAQDVGRRAKAILRQATSMAELLKDCEAEIGL